MLILTYFILSNMTLCFYLVICYTIRFLYLLWYCYVKHLNNIIHFLLKISLIWCDKFSCNFKYIFINETGFIKKNCNSYGGKFTKSIVLQDKTGLLRALRGGDRIRKISPSCIAGQRGGKIKPCEIETKTPSFIPVPSHCNPTGECQILFLVQHLALV